MSAVPGASRSSQDVLSPVCRTENGASEKKMAKPSTHERRRTTRRASRSERVSSRSFAGGAPPGNGAARDPAQFLRVLRIALEIFLHESPRVGAALLLQV